MILAKGQLPAACRGHRILVKPHPPVEESSRIIAPEESKMIPHKGVIIAAGLNALDEMYDHGDQVGDEVWWGKFAGVIEEWDHIKKQAAKGAKCKHAWTAKPAPRLRTREWSCDRCASVRIAEFMLVMNVGDLLANVSLQRRLEKTSMSVKRGKTADGRTQHYIDRKDR